MGLCGFRQQLEKMGYQYPKHFSLKLAEQAMTIVLQSKLVQIN